MLEFTIHRLIENIFFEDSIVNEEFVKDLNDHHLKLIVRSNGYIQRYGVDYYDIKSIKDYMNATYHVIKHSCVNSHCINILEISNRSLIAGYTKDEKGNISKIYHIFKTNRIETTKLNDLKIISKGFNPLSNHYNDKVFDKIYCKEILGLKRVTTFKRLLKFICMTIIATIVIVGTLSFITLPLLYFLAYATLKQLIKISNMIDVSVLLTIFCSIVFWIYIISNTYKSKKEHNDLGIYKVRTEYEFEENEMELYAK